MFSYLLILDLWFLQYLPLLLGYHPFILILASKSSLKKLLLPPEKQITNLPLTLLEAISKKPFDQNPKKKKKNPSEVLTPDLE